MKLLEIRGLGTSGYTVAIDLDGVLADFDAKVYEVFNKRIAEIPKRDLWNGISKYNKTVEPFFETLPAMNDYKTLVTFVDNNFGEWFILTATGNTPKDAGEQKKRWVAKVLSPRINVVTVRKSEEKAKYANENTILVDDRAKSIDPWVAAGGIGILHTSAQKTITELEKYIG